jgi:hypothetical protein
MKVIHKYSLQDTPGVVTMPESAVILSVGAQVGKKGVMIWAMIDLTAKLVQRTFNVFYTGELLPENPGRFISTVDVGTAESGSLIIHIFQSEPKSEVLVEETFK